MMEAQCLLDKDKEVLPLPTFSLIMKLWPCRLLGRGILLPAHLYASQASSSNKLLFTYHFASC